MALATATQEHQHEQRPEEAHQANRRADLRVVEAPRWRMLRLSIRRLRIVSVVRTVGVLAALVAAALIASGVAVWWFAGRAGLIAGLEESVATGLGMESWTLPAGSILLVWVAAVLALVALAVFVAVLLAVAFNALGRSVGGIDVVARAERIPAER